MSVHVPTERLPGPTASAPAKVDPAPAGERGRPTRRRRESKLRRRLVATDAAALTAAWGSIELWGGFHGGQTTPIVRDLALLLVGIPVWILLAQGHNLYHADSRRADHGWTEELVPILQMATLWSWGILLGISATDVRPVGIPKLSLFWGLTILLLLVLRSGTRFVARRRPWYRQATIVVGPAVQAATVVRRVLRHPEYGIDIVACVDTVSSAPLESLAERKAMRSIGSIPMVRGTVDLQDLIDEWQIERVMFAAGAKETRDGEEILCGLAEREVQIDLVPSWSDVVGRRLDFHELEGLPLMSLPRTVMRRSDQVRKRAFDVMVSAVALAVLAPLFILCAVAIKLDSDGPVLFRQRRVGRDDRRFEVYKFRSMRTNADEQKEKVAALNFHGGGNHQGMFKIREDPRVTRVGRFLRRTSLDELPQLLNVLKGDMSLVGPRPLIEVEDRQVEGRFRRRLSYWPGLTGPWQIHGRSEIPFDEMINLDYLYVTNWSLWGDVKLMLRTVHAVVGGHGAY